MKAASLVLGMYAITFSLFVVETGCVVKAASLGFAAASLKSVFCLGHGAFWRWFESE